MTPRLQLHLYFQGTQASHKEAEARSLKMRLATSETHAELIKIYSSPHFPQSPLVINPRTVTKIKHTSSFFPALSQCDFDSAMDDDTDLNTTIVCHSENKSDDGQLSQEEQVKLVSNTVTTAHIIKVISSIHVPWLILNQIIFSNEVLKVI